MSIKRAKFPLPVVWGSYLLSLPNADIDQSAPLKVLRPKSMNGNDVWNNKLKLANSSSDKEAKGFEAKGRAILVNDRETQAPSIRLLHYEVTRCQVTIRSKSKSDSALEANRSEANRRWMSQICFTSSFLWPRYTT